MKVKKYNPLSLNIINSLDLIEKIKPLLLFVTSHLKKFKDVNNNNPPYDGLEIKTLFGFSGPINTETLFKINFKN